MISHFELTAGNPNPQRTREQRKPGIIDRFAAAHFPAWALKRQVARNRLERVRLLQDNFKRGFEATSGNRLRYGFSSTSSDADSFIKDGSSGLREHVRYMEYQNGFISGPVQRIVNNVVGMGVRFQSRVIADDSEAAERFNNQAEKAFKKWGKQADVRLIHTFFELQRLVEAALLRDGEVLVIGRRSGRRDRIIPYCLQLLEIDRLGTPPSEITNPNITNGIEFDSEGVYKRFYVLKQHPGNTIGTGLRNDDYEEIDAWNPNGTRKVLYLYNPIRPEQLRGFSQFAAALKDFQDLDRYREAEIMAALEDACLTGFVKSDAAYAFQNGYTSDSDSDSNRIHDFAPNKWHYLRPGEDVYIHAPSRPNTQFGETTNQLLAGPANALDVPPEVLSQNWKDMNYSNARTVLLQFYLSCRVRQQYLIEHFCIPAYEAFLMSAVSMGKVQAPGLITRKDDYMAHAWIPGGWDWVDPVKEAEGKELEVSNSFDTYAGVCAGKGLDAEENLEANARFLRRKKELAEKYEIEWPETKKASPGGSSSGDQSEQASKPRFEVVR